MNTQKRQEIERKIVRHLIRTMKTHGWDIAYINDGGEPDEDIHNPNETKAMNTVFSVDESTIYFRKQIDAKTGMTHFVQIVLGNDGWDCISDYSYAENDKDDFEAVMKNEVDPYCEKLERSV